MKFLHLHLFQKEVEFGNIEGYDDIKGLLRRALDSDENYNLLFVGPPASAKTLFLLGNLDIRKGVYFDASNTTSRILDVLEEERPKIILLDELDKMGRAWQNQLLNFLESGRIKVAVKRNVAINDHVILTQRWKHGATRDLLTKVVSLDKIADTIANQRDI